MICADETPQQAQIKQKRIFKKKTADAKGYSVFVFQEVVPPKGTNKLPRNLARPTANNRSIPEWPFLLLSTGRAAYYEIIKLHNASSENCCIPADLHEDEYLMVNPLVTSSKGLHAIKTTGLRRRMISISH